MFSFLLSCLLLCLSLVYGDDFRPIRPELMTQYKKTKQLRQAEKGKSESGNDTSEPVPMLLRRIQNDLNFKRKVPKCDERCEEPRKPRTERDWLRIGHHDLTQSYKEMYSNIERIRQRRGQERFDGNNEYVKSKITAYKAKHNGKKPPNFLLIVADDLGYGDLSVCVFFHHSLIL
jgi:hypothetical protein